jgi:hypothetical protein
MSSRIYQVSERLDESAVTSSRYHRVRRIVAKAALIGSLTFSVLSLATPAYARIKRSLDSAWDAASRSDSQTVAQPAPLMFIANEGQFDQSILFGLEDAGGSVVFTSNSIMVAVKKPGNNPPWVVEEGSSGEVTPTPEPEGSGEEDIPAPEFNIVEIEFNGVNTAPEIGGLNQLETKVSYFLGDDPNAWKTDVPVFGKILYSDFAAGYDLEIDGSTGVWEWRLVASSGNTADEGVSGIPKSYAAMQSDEGEELPELTLVVEGGDVSLEEGEILIETEGSSFTLPLIEVPQDLQPESPSVNDGTVESPYTTDDGSEMTRVPANRQNANGTMNLLSLIPEIVNGLSVSDSADWNRHYQGDEKGELVFSSLFGGESDDLPMDVAYDQNDNIYLTGRRGTVWVWPASTGTYGKLGSWDIYVGCINENRQLAYLAFIGGSYEDDSSGIVVDENSNAYVVGSSRSPNFPTNMAYQPNHANTDAMDMILFRLSSDGNALLYSTYFGARIHEHGYGIAYVPGSSGKVYIAGDTSSSHTYDAFHSYAQITRGDGVIAGFDTSQSGAGSLIAIRFFGGVNTEDEAHGIAFDETSGDIWVVGHTLEKQQPNDFTGFNGFDSQQDAGFDAFIANVSSIQNHTTMSISFFGGNGYECEQPGSMRECDVAVDGQGNAYITGNTLSDDLPEIYPQENDFQNYGDNEDVFAAKVHTEPCAIGGGYCMTLDYWRYLGGSGTESARTISVDTEGNAYISGVTSSDDFIIDVFPTGLSPFPEMHAGDAFLVRLDPEGNVTFFTYFGGSSAEGGMGVALLEEEEESKAVIVGGMSGYLGDLPFSEYADPIDVVGDTGWEGFIAEFTVPDWEFGLEEITISSPRNWDMVLSLRPEFQWEPLVGVDHYALEVYRTAGDKNIPSSIQKTITLRSDVIYFPSCDPINENDFCFKWKERNPFSNGGTQTAYELTSGEELAKGGYAYEVKAYNENNTLIAESETAYFQIPPMGKTWTEYRKTCNQPECLQDNPYWMTYDDLFYHWGEHYNIPPTMLKAILIAEVGNGGGMIYINGQSEPYPPHMNYGYEPGWDWIMHWFRDWYYEYKAKNIPLETMFTVFDASLAEQLIYHKFPSNNEYYDYQYFHLDDNPADPLNNHFIEHHDLYAGGYVEKYAEYTEHVSSNNVCYLVYDAYVAGLPVPETIQCPFPFNYTIPDESDPNAMSIFNYAYYHMWEKSVTDAPFGASLMLLPRCASFDQSECVASRDWIPAQYRLSASYGLGMVTYWDRDDLMKDHIPPEQLYDPVWGSREMARTLSEKRCYRSDYIRNVGMTNEYGETPWEEWRWPLDNYNGKDDGNFVYANQIIGRRDSIKPTAIVKVDGSDPAKIFPTSLPHCDDLPDMVAVDSDNTPATENVLSAIEKIFTNGILSVVFAGSAENTNEQILEGNEYYFGDNTYWVENVYIEYPNAEGIGSGFVRIYSDSQKTELLWQSPEITSVYPYSTVITGMLDLFGHDVLFSTWKVGLHSYRFYPIIYTGYGFLIAPIENGGGIMEDGFFSDRGGIFPFPDGSVAVGQKTFNDEDETLFHIYLYDGFQYYLSRILSLSPDGSDITPPTTSVQLDTMPNEEGWWKNLVQMRLTATDNEEVLMVYAFVDEMENRYLLSPRGEVSLPFDEGRWNIGYFAVDTSGNQESKHYQQIKIDRTAADVNMFINELEIAESWIDINGTATVDLQAEDPNLVDGTEGSGVKTIEYSINLSEDWISYEAPVVFEEAGTYPFRYRVVDNAGNVSEIIEKTIRVDLEAPSVFINIMGPEPQNGYYSEENTINIAAEDPMLPDETVGTGISKIEYLWEGTELWQEYDEPVNVPGEGFHRIIVRATDYAGNMSQENSVELFVDSSAPLTNILINDDLEVPEYISEFAVIVLFATDPMLPGGIGGSGVEKIEYSIDTQNNWYTYSGPFGIEGSGSHILRYRSMDYAGNIEETNEVTFRIDNEAPIVRAQIFGDDPTNGWYNKPITIELSAEDPQLDDGEMGSGLMGIEYCFEGTDEWIEYVNPIVVSISSYQWVYFRAIDTVGNISEDGGIEVPVDLEAPQSTASIIGESSPTGTYPPGTAITVQSQDVPFPDGNDGTGVWYIEYSLDLQNAWDLFPEMVVLEELGIHTFYYRAVDWAGNEEEVKNLEIEIEEIEDNDPPEVLVFADPLMLWPPNHKVIPVHIFGTAVDQGSGIQRIHIDVIDEYGEFEPTVQDILPEEIIDGYWERTIQLLASRDGNDEDGRIYTIKITVSDNLGNITVREVEVIVPHDQGQ